MKLSANVTPQSRTARLILIGYLILAVAYSVVVPIFEASDEQWHYPTVKYIADHGFGLPVQVPGEVTAWRQEGSQPPLYYFMGALLTFWIDTSDMDRVRRINPHADIGLTLPDGNINMAIHDPAVEAFPWRGTVLAVHLVRLLSVGLGAITVWMTYQLGLRLFPGTPGIALGGMAFTAFNPMFLFISGSVNNDNLSTALASLLLVQICDLIRRSDAPSIRDLVGIGVISGAGMLAKFQIGFLLPIIAAALLWNAIRAKTVPSNPHPQPFPRTRGKGVNAIRVDIEQWRRFVIGAAITGGLTILIAGWWYIRNAQLYSDPTGLNVFLKIVGERPIPANFAQLWSERHTFFMSYWGLFGGVNLPFPNPVYVIFVILAALSVWGLIVSAIKVEYREMFRRDRDLWIMNLLCALWIVVLFIGLIRWTTSTWASQGRLMFSAIAPLSLFMAAGIHALGGNRLSQYTINRSEWWYVIAAVFGLGVNFYAYSNGGVIELEGGARQRGLRAATTLTSSAAGTFNFAEPRFPNAGCELTVKSDYSPWFVRLPVESEAPDRLYAVLYLEWTQSGSCVNDWTLFAHVVNEEGVIIAQRDRYLRYGLHATSIGQTGQLVTFQELVSVPLSPTLRLATNQLPEVRVGFYNLQTGARLPIKSSNSPGDVNRVEADTFRVGLLPLATAIRQMLIDRPISFDNRINLLNYELAKFSYKRGETIPLTLTWQRTSDQPLTTDYRVFAQVMQPNTANVFARSDAMPAAWTRPTSTWQANETITDQHELKIDENAPPGTWELCIGLYDLQETSEGQRFDRLRIIQPDGSQPDDKICLTRIRIE